MTNLEALQSLTEFSDTNLFTKVMTDRGVTPGDTYAAGNAQVIDLCLADVYLRLAASPDISEYGLSVKWTRESLMAARKTLYDKWGLALPESTSRRSTPGVTGRPVTVGGKTYPAW